MLAFGLWSLEGWAWLRLIVSSLGLSRFVTLLLSPVMVGFCNGLAIALTDRDWCFRHWPKFLHARACVRLWPGLSDEGQISAAFGFRLAVMKPTYQDSGCKHGQKISRGCLFCVHSKTPALSVSLLSDR
mmetsp:Transcript_113647/g.361016  ORF Transcript_113647/g.361016 Transcript_113647/m.361016 type:complete len:129 (+) Transcript_113647:634-1020(+)